MTTSLLNTIDSPADLRKLSRAQLRTVADEVRQKVLDTVSQTGGHLGSNLGTVELTVALHYVFNTPHDRLVWDVGHQTYPHKILTGRRDRMNSLRQLGGIGVVADGEGAGRLGGLDDGLGAVLVLGDHVDVLVEQALDRLGQWLRTNRPA